MSAPIGLRAAGLPGPLPAGERILWQGRPSWRAAALRVLHVRKLAVYFALLLAYYLVSRLATGMPLGQVALTTTELTGLALAPLALLTGYARATEWATVYTVTNKRVLIKFGVGFSMTINLPFAKIEGASLRQAPDGTGDIALTLVPHQPVSYIILWPHVRSWYMGRTEPALRSVPDAARVAQVLSRALAASAEVAVQPAALVRPEPVGAGGRAAAAA